VAPGAVLVLVLVTLTLSGCGTAARQLPAQSHPAPVARLRGGAPAHIAVVVMENVEYGDIVGSGSTPYINALARRGALAQQMYAITHPSLPNYLALPSGATHGLTDACTACSIPGAGVVAQLPRAGATWRAHLEDRAPVQHGEPVGERLRRRVRLPPRRKRDPVQSLSPNDERLFVCLASRKEGSSCTIC